MEDESPPKKLGKLWAFRAHRGCIDFVEPDLSFRVQFPNFVSAATSIVVFPASVSFHVQFPNLVSAATTIVVFPAFVPRAFDFFTSSVRDTTSSCRCKLVCRREVKFL